MPTCFACGEIYYDRCRPCRAMYQEDLNAKPKPRIPPQFVAIGETFEFNDWAAIRHAERTAIIPRNATPEEAQLIRARAAASAISEQLLLHRKRRETDAETPAQRRAKLNAEIRSRYTYSAQDTVGSYDSPESQDSTKPSDAESDGKKGWLARLFSRFR